MRWYWPGGISPIPLYEGYAPGYKALLEFRGKPAIAYTLDALRGVPQIGEACIVGDEPSLRGAVARSGAEYCDFMPGGETLVESIFSGLSHFASSPAVLIVTADLPLLTSGAVRDFLSACSAVESGYEHNFLLSVVPERCYSGFYRDFTADFNRFRDIAACHGNLGPADPRLLQNKQAMARINKLYQGRKSPLASALAISWRVGLSYIVGAHLLHRLTLDRMASIASRRFHIGLIPVILEHPEATIDVDEPANYAFVCRQLA
ncbi:MAG: nucleotidyltransferase family protein [Armatimonadetes bacterium]|nr:nucleotidyltransferase family protein [Armatimonadota bacterium]